MRTFLLIPWIWSCQDPSTTSPADESEDAEEQPEIPQRAPPDIAVIGELDFGGVPKGCTETRTLSIENRGEEPLQIESITAVGNGASTINIFSPFNNFLAGGEQDVIEVDFTPSGWLSYSFDLLIEINDPDEPQVWIPIVGEGERLEPITEEFVVSVSESLDVLWVVGNSGPSLSYLEDYQENLTGIVDVLDAQAIDWQVAVLSTDTSESGRFRGPIIRSGAPDPHSMLAQQLEGLTPRSDEDGFDTLATALLNPSRPGFFRESADLAVIFFAEDEQGGDANGVTDALSGLGRDASNLWVLGLMTGDPFNDLFSMYSLDDLVKDFHGEVWELEDGHLHTQIEEAHLFTVGYRSMCSLSEQLASLDDVTVTINEEPIPQGLKDGWTYDSAENAILFHGDARPEPGASVSVTFTPEADCG
ncbi:MAG: hypothetical protein AAFV53_32010 [Myxococcota bacterium]